MDLRICPALRQRAGLLHIHSRHMLATWGGPREHRAPQFLLNVPRNEVAPVPKDNHFRLQVEAFSSEAQSPQKREVGSTEQ